jgi:hypothetical protein
MGTINVEGLGSIKIAGDTPTPEEEKSIIKALDKVPASQLEIDLKASDFTKSTSFTRLGLEIGLGIAGSVFTGGLALPVLARAGMLARPFLTQLAKSSAGSAIGSGAGAVAAQPFDPKEDIVKEITRASIEGALGEAVGAPVGIKIAEKMASRLSPKIKLLESAKDAEDVLKTQKEIILANPGKYDPELLNAAGKAILTPALKTDNQLIDIAQNVVEKSLLGSGEILAAKAGAQKVTESALKDFVEPIIKNTDATQTGRLFIDALTDSKELFRAQAKKNYDILDREVSKLGDNKVVDISKYNKLLQEQLNKLPKGGVNTPNAKRLLENNIYRDADGNFVNKLTFSEANDLRSDILALGRDLTGTDNAKYIGAQKLISDQLTKAIDTAYVPDTLKNAYKKANSFYKEGLNSYNDTVIEKILSKEDGKDAFKTIVSGSDKGETVQATVKQIDKIFKNDPTKARELKDSLRGTVLDDMMKKSYIENGQYGESFSPTKMGNYMKKMEGTFGQLFNERELAQLNKLNTATSVAHGKLSKEGGLPGGVFIQLAQAGAATTALTFNPDASGLTGAAAILLGPKAVGKLLVSPKFNQYLTEGLATNNGTKAGVAFRQLVGRMVSDKLIPEEEGKAAIEKSKKLEQQLKTGGQLNAPVQKQPQSLNMPPVNTRVTDIKQSVITPARQPIPAGVSAAPRGDIKERIAESNLLDQFINA